ncbi:hypothetical protein [Sphingomonas sp. SUN039]|uniref:hypothetical protein n=1 Tax=Sphingomonas sp. SUN039 TaxID=2937787 RepID=UPI002164503D|nr:hypothetical protein [Sphingomonas sp. SUN039]UVO54834.1 hypothetical protein M0209_12140 [Sphingomonas sp. SUN039]
MSFWKLLFAVILLPICAVQAATPGGELGTRKAILDATGQAATARDFARLSALETDYATHRVRTPSGTWKLALFHAQLRYAAKGKQIEGSCDNDAARFLADWRAATPDAPGPSIVGAAVLVDRAWCLRGSGTAAQVDPAAWPKVAAAVAEAHALLAANKRVASADPEYYAVMAEIYLLQGRDKAAFRRMLDEATAREPAYWPLYFNAFQYYQPQWFGSYAEVDALARFAAERSSAVEGTGGYARFYWHLDQCNCLRRSEIDWPTMKTAMADVAVRYPDDWNFANFAKIACRMGDGSEAGVYLGKLGSDGDAAWTEPVEHAVCRQLAARSAAH